MLLLLLLLPRANLCREAVGVRHRPCFFVSARGSVRAPMPLSLSLSLFLSLSRGMFSRRVFVDSGVASRDNRRLFWEIVPKYDADRKLLPEMILAR